MSRTLKSESYDLGNIRIPSHQPLTWKIKTESCALLIHDMQRYFVHALPDNPAVNLINSTVKILRWAREKNIPVFYSAQPGRMTMEQRGLLVDLWGPGMRTTEEDRQIIDALFPYPEDTVLTKWRYSAFHQSDLADRLCEHQCDSLIITGIYASVGIQATGIDAFSHNIHPFVVADAIADFTQAGHQNAVDYMADNCARVLTSADVVNYE
ncbi:isochorismatase family protein [Xenorhabdus sp. 42]|uniref:Isochorismatase family protein n=1 Tax=Xenorhabdus szentirmaii TaxID=290112 RepID=A0AAW3YZG0_9GAMM|nr:MULTISPECIES: isochorismatase family protein [unclassified Xenorhabdus]MBD2781099.1 isochorismatase family protein [Xenorhabdus sp. 38]MBD2792357.1 isochorismatase family protein [Xenorhabdus sp. CUL]MBD2802206.1 isochorismatase family protein [Xenorhabdus sp. M]MBD2806045.1 isochorismatase family protein [Xenorhabdus sp. ZM]MBD2820969.1 isochorismatase family protein [Xenorhabdus sp. 42]